MDDFLKRQILAFDLHKKQTYVDRIMKEGEIIGLKRMIKLYQNLMENNPSDEFKVYHDILKNSLHTATDELYILKASENIFSTLDKDVQDSLTSLDILERVKIQKDEFSPDVQARIKTGKCALKRPGGKKKFSCDDNIIAGTKYCKTHLKKYEPIKYCELIPKDL
jgi:hypothetical protein